MIYTLKLDTETMVLLCEALAVTRLPDRTTHPLVTEIWLQCFAPLMGNSYPEPKAPRRKPKLKHAKETSTAPAAEPNALA